MKMVSVTEARAILINLMYPERAALPERHKIALMLGAEALERAQPRELLTSGGRAASCPCCLLEVGKNAKKYAVSYCQRCGQALKMNNPYMAQLSGGKKENEGI